MTTIKDLTILSQSQLQRAIEICKLIGFPVKIKDQEYPIKLEYIVKTLTPWLMEQSLENVIKVKDRLN